MLFPIFLCILAADPSWPQFRGPASNPVGEDKKLPTHWSKTENIEWAASIPGRGWSSPIAQGGKVYLTTVTTEGKSKSPQMGTEYSNEYAAELMKQGLDMKTVMAKVTARDMELPDEVMLHYFLYCLDLKTGAVVWKTEFYTGHPPGGRHRKNSFTSETPVTDGKALYVYIANLGLYAFDLKGKPLWVTPLEMNPIYFDFGTGGSPALNANQLVILSDNQKHQYVAAYDTATGKQIWQTDRDIGEQRAPDAPVMRSGWTTPFIWKNALRTEIVAVGPSMTISYDLEGKELWRLSGMAVTPIPSPFSVDGLLFVFGGRGKPLFAIKPGGKGDITPAKGERSSEAVVWSDPRGGSYLPTPVAYEGAMYVLNEVGILTRFEIQTGKVSYKTRLDAAGGDFTVSPWAYNGKIFCLSEEGKTYVVAAGETFQLLHSNVIANEMAMASPAIVGDRLLLRTDSKLYSIRGGR